MKHRGKSDTLSPEPVVHDNLAAGVRDFAHDSASVSMMLLGKTDGTDLPKMSADGLAPGPCDVSGV
jgi:hypothetical protein